jgi:hypothetical protein
VTPTFGEGVATTNEKISDCLRDEDVACSTFAHHSRTDADRDTADFPGDDLAFADVDSSSNVDSNRAQSIAERESAIGCPRGRIERGVEAVTSRIDFHAVMAVQFVANDRVVLLYQPSPTLIAKLGGHRGTTNDVLEEQRGEETLNLGRPVGVRIGCANLVQVNSLTLLRSPNAKVTHLTEPGGAEQSEDGLAHEDLAWACAMAQTRCEHRCRADELCPAAYACSGVYTEGHRDLKVRVCAVVALQRVRDRCRGAYCQSWRRKREMERIRDVVNLEGLSSERASHEALVGAHENGGVSLASVQENSPVAAEIHDHVRS